MRDTTVLVVDEYGEGFPVAWYLSNRQDEFLLTNFFEAVRNRVGKCVPKVLVSDDAEQFYTAWIDVYLDQDQRNCCAHGM